MAGIPLTRESCTEGSIWTSAIGKAIGLGVANDVHVALTERASARRDKIRYNIMGAIPGKTYMAVKITSKTGINHPSTVKLVKSASDLGL